MWVLFGVFFLQGVSVCVCYFGFFQLESYDISSKTLKNQEAEVIGW